MEKKFSTVEELSPRFSSEPKPGVGDLILKFKISL